MNVKAWKNGKHAQSGTSYGLDIPPSERDRFLSRKWENVVVRLPNGNRVVANIAKASFWRTCPHLIHHGFKQWFFDRSLAPWPKGQPPVFKLEHRGDNAFDLVET